MTLSPKRVSASVCAMYSAKAAESRYGARKRTVVHGVLGFLLASRISLSRGMPSVTFLAATPELWKAAGKEKEETHKEETQN